ncbi:MAG: protease inhibitor I42 family protein [Burkholderiales bacterium]|nr:protease inhibitor I42 family protein [Burkholderiales bacterium]
MLCAFGLASCTTLVRDEVAAPPGGGAVSVRTGTPLIVSLPVDPDTGAGWVLRTASPNLALIGGPDHTPAPRPPGLVGVPNTTAYRFRALDPGSGALEFAWVSAPGQAPAQRTVRYDVTVTPRPTMPTDFFGTVGMESVRGGAYAPASDAPAKVNTTPNTTRSSDVLEGTSAPSPVRYWTH